MASPKDANIYHGQVVGNGIGGTINMAPTAPAPAAKPDPSVVTQHAEQYTSSYTAYPAPHRCPPAPYMRPQKPPPPAYYGYGDFDGYWGEAAGAYGGGRYYGYRPPQPPPYGGGDGGGYGYYPPSELGWGAGGYSYDYGGGGFGGGGYGGRGGYGGGGGGYAYGGGGGGGSYGRPPPPHVGTGWIAAAGAAAYGAYQHHMRKHHQGHGHGHGGGDVCGACGGRGCSHGGCAAIHGEFEHEHHTKFKHSTAHHHDGNCSEHDIAQAPHVTVLEKRTTEVVQA